MRPDNGGTMPGKSTPFTPSSILFRPRLGISSQWYSRSLTTDPLMVEAPGTAPGSDRFIATAIYCHSRLAPAPRNISVKGCRKKSGAGAMKLLSGGQSGVDRAVLDAAIARGIAYAGWCPKGGRAEDFPAPPG